MNREVLENIAVNAVSDRLLSMHVQPKIESNDKTPVTDGFLFLYSSDKDEEFSNSDLIGEIPIQIKAKSQKKLPKEYKYSISKRMLTGIKNFGGLGLFVVYITENTKIIRFRELSKLVVERMLKQLHGKDSKSIVMFEFSNDDEVALNRLNRAMEQISSQGIVYKVDPLNKPQQLRLKTYGNEELDEALYKSEVILYAVEGSALIPYLTIDPETVSVQKIRPIEVGFSKNGEIFNSDLKSEQDTLELATGYEKKIVLSINNKENKFEISLGESTSYYDQLANVDLLLDMIENGVIYFEDKEVDLHLPKTDKKMKDYVTWLKYQKKRLGVVKILEKNTHLPFSSMHNSHSDKKVMEMVINAYNYPEKTKGLGIYREEVDDKVYFIVIIPNGHETPIVQSLFSNWPSSQLNMKYQDSKLQAKEVEVSVNPYTFGAEDLEKIGDFKSEFVCGWYKQNGINSYNEQVYANRYSFRLLEAYVNTKRREFLDTAIWITKFLFDYKPNDDIAFLNYVQAVKRVGAGIDSKQLTRLLKIYTEGTTEEIFAAGLLLEVSNNELSTIWSTLSEGERKNLKALPIFDYVTDSLLNLLD